MNPYHWRMIISLVLTIAFVVLGGLLLPKLPSSSMVADLFWSNKAYPEKTFDVVFIGDSRIYRGIDPTSVEEELRSFAPLSVFNYGFSSAGLDSAFMEAGANLLDSHSKQPIIVLGITTSALADENLANPHHWQEKNRAALAVWQRKTINPYLSFFDPTSPTVLRNEYEGKRQGYYQDYKLNGWIASDKFPRNEWQGYGHIEKTYPTVDFSAAVRKNLIKKVAAWEQQGIQVFGFRPPAAKHFEAIETRVAYYPEKALVAQFEAVGGTWIEIENRADYVTYDGNHLEQKSAKHLSHFVGKKIRQHLEKQSNNKAKELVLMESSQTFEQPIQTPWTAPHQNAFVQNDAFEGQNAYSIPPQQYSCTYINSLDSLLGENVYIRTSCWMKSKAPEKEANAVLVISIQNKEGTILWKGQKFMEQTLDPLAWNCINLNTNYHNNLAGCTIKVYVWNKGKQAMLIDDFKVSLLKF
ncbi:hypothetical protein [Aureispira anguillae]|uniref:Uncharacterized protein n=1 Tax=Aureispira anguillae TaxID=2864201 RepID=A0A915YK28_9BACT|nr:hypothetical protein [Aureispira anguillae]BDS14253.1 hypothetical protein AsAng_0050320 [Aureispira anguillae]